VDKWSDTKEEEGEDFKNEGVRVPKKTRQIRLKGGENNERVHRDKK